MDEAEDIAGADALIKISTLGRDVDYKTVKELVEAVFKSAKYRVHLPEMVMYVRNHAKSLAAGVGLGEKLVSLQLFCALYEIDHPIGITLVKDMVLYGSWKSLAQILKYTDDLNTADNAEYKPDSTHRFSLLHQEIHMRFAAQLQADNESTDKDAAVSNASKYLPHEGRVGTMKYHADKISEILFPDFAGKFPEKKHTVRRLYRKLRSKLNLSNKHIAEIYLSTKRAAELFPNMICAGTYSKLQKALLNVNKRGAERYDDEGRRLLRTRILAKIEKDPTAIPAPSDILQLAEKLLKINSADESMDEGEKLLLRAMYKSAVAELRKVIDDGVKDARDLAAKLDLSEVERANVMAELVAVPLAVAIDCSISQKHTHPVSCLLAVMLADVAVPQEQHMDESVPMEAETSATATPVVAAAVDAAVPLGPAPAVVLFSDAAHVMEIPMEGAVEVRLEKLISACRGRSRGEDAAGEGMVVDGGAAGQANYAAALAALEGEAFAGRDVLLCSDFRESEALAEALREWRARGQSRVVSCWRMIQSKAGRVRARKPVWDPVKPRLEVVFCLDTTGSMGHCIAQCRETIAEVLRSLRSRAGMPVSCAFVSYKDFGDADHLEVADWVDASDADGMARLQAFVAGLHASGGGDAPEDVAGGLEKVVALFEARRDPALRMCMLIADAPCHGIQGSGDSHSKHNGECQLERTLRALRRLCLDGGAELLFCCADGGGKSVKDMVAQFDRVLEAVGTYVDEFPLEGAAGTMFRDKILGSLESCVAAAVAPPTEGLGADLFGGTDFSVPQLVACSRFRGRMRELAMRIAPSEEARKSAAMAEAAKAAEEALAAAKEAGDAEAAAKAEVAAKLAAEAAKVAAEAAKVAEAKAASPVELLLAKLAAEEYDAVRCSMGSVTEGAFAGFEWKNPLSEKAVAALVRGGGVSETMLRAAGYPEEVVRQVQVYILESMAKTGGTEGVAAKRAARVGGAARGRGGSRGKPRGRGRGRGRGH